MPVGEPLLVMPRDPGEVLDRAALTVRRTFPQSLRAVLIGYLPWAILLHLPMVPGSQKFSTGMIPPPDEVYRHLVWVCVWMVADILLVRQFLRGWLFAIAGAELRGMTITNRQAAAHGLRRLPAAAIATLLTFGPFGLLLILMTGLAAQQETLLIVAMIAAPMSLLIGLPLATFGYVSVAAAVLERRGPFRAVGRSFRLAASGAGTLIAVVIVQFIVRMFAGLMPSLAPNLWIQSVLYVTAMSLLAIFEVAVESVLYFTLRCRRENYDLELLAREVELFGADELQAARPAFDRLTLGTAPLDPATDF